jgi:hypothetical protein
MVSFPVRRALVEYHRVRFQKAHHRAFLPLTWALYQIPLNVKVIALRLARYTLKNFAASEAIKLMCIKKLDVKE